MKMRRNDYTKKIKKLKEGLEELRLDLGEIVEARDCAEKVQTQEIRPGDNVTDAAWSWCNNYRQVVLAVLDDRRRSIEKRILSHEHKIQEAQGLRSMCS